MASYTKKAVKGAGIVLFMTVASYILGYVFRIAIAKGFALSESGYRTGDVFQYLMALAATEGDPSSYGLFYEIVAFFGLLSLFMNFGLRSSLVKFIPEYKARNQPEKIKGSIIVVTACTFLFSAATCGLVFMFSDRLAGGFFKDPGAADYIRVYAVGMIFASLSLSLRSAFNGFQSMMHYSSVDFLKSVASTALTLALLFFGMHLMAPVLGFTLTYVVILPAVYFYVLFRKVFPEFFKVKADLSMPLTQKVFYYGFATMMVDVAATLNGYTDSVLLTLFRTANDVGLYNAALPTLKLLSVIGATIIPVMAPMSCELWAAGKKEQLQTGFSMVYKYAMIMLLPVLLILALFPETIIATLFGAKFGSAGDVLRILAFAYAINIFIMANSSILVAIDKPKEAGKIAVYGSLMHLAFNVALIPAYGIVGAAISTLISFFATFAMSLRKIWKHARFAPPWKELTATLLIGVFIGLLSHTMKLLDLDVWARMGLTVVLGGALYVALLFLTRMLTKEEVQGLAKRVRH